MVTDLKYEGKRGVALLIAESIAQTLHSVEAPDVVTWIPTSDAHRLSRGFDHAELIARHTSVFIRGASVRLLRRTSDTHQTGNSREFRLENVSFVASPRARGKHVCIIDDVWTTGATFRAAVQALVRVGATQVTCIAYAHVE